MTLIGGAELATAGQIGLMCRRYNGENFPDTRAGGSEPLARWVHVTAVRVEDLTRQEP